MFQTFTVFSSFTYVSVFRAFLFLPGMEFSPFLLASVITPAHVPTRANWFASAFYHTRKHVSLPVFSNIKSSKGHSICWTMYRKVIKTCITEQSKHHKLEQIHPNVMISKLHFKSVITLTKWFKVICMCDLLHTCNFAQEKDCKWLSCLRFINFYLPRNIYLSIICLI